MAAITVTASAVEVLDPSKAEIYAFVVDSGATVAVGDLVAVNSSGLAVLADADGAGTLKEVKGMVVSRQGKTVSVLKRGRVAGLTLTGVYGSRLYLSATAGGFDTAITGTVAAIGQVVPLSDSSATKVAYIDIPWNTAFA